MNKSNFEELRNKHIAIIGGTGTLGRALTAYLIREEVNPAKILVISRDEVKQLEMMNDFPEGDKIPIQYFIGDVRDVERMTELLRGMDLVIHAAALKHVVMAEKNPEECWKTNVEGTRNVREACAKNSVRKCILISTDKAVNPVGVYGESKYQAESIFLESVEGQVTDFRIVRLGNVVDARGSVFELFRKQRQTGVVEVTHEEATRFYISQEKAAQFILRNFLHCQLEKVSYPIMKSIRIMDLAKTLAPDCDIVITGLRAGDKLHEELGGKTSQECVVQADLSLI